MRSNKNRLSLERLEAREVMDATLSVSGGALIIEGTNKADALHVREVVLDGRPAYQVDALSYQGRHTTFNDGQTSAAFRASRLSADLGGGNDLLILDDLSTRSSSPIVPPIRPISLTYPSYGIGFGYYNLTPRLISGINYVSQPSVSVSSGDVTINTGAGNDEVRLANVDVSGKAVIDLGGGHDVVSVSNTSLTKSMEVMGRAGDDHFIDLDGNDYGVNGLKLSSLTATHRESVDGQVTSQIAPTASNPLGTMEAVGAGTATYLGDYTETFFHNFTAPNADGVGQVLNGQFASTASDGSTISGTYHGTYTLLDATTARFDVTPLWLNGTGRFAGVTGRATVVAIMDLTTGAFHFDTIGTWTFP